MIALIFKFLSAKKVDVKPPKLEPINIIGWHLFVIYNSTWCICLVRVRLKKLSWFKSTILSSMLTSAKGLRKYIPLLDMGLEANPCR